MSLPIQISDIFLFKKFQIAQNYEVFRVNTEAILLASWMRPTEEARILEIGSGTGVISIALDHRFEGQNEISCIDIDANAFDLTLYNIYLNQCNSIEASHLSLQELAESSLKVYDVIVSNPPFFEGTFKSTKARNALAKYTDSLPFDSLLTLSSHLLTETGTIYLILPIQAMEEVELICARIGLFIGAKCSVSSKKGKKTNRVLLEISKKNREYILETTLSILEKNGDYSEEYKALTKEFYTIF